MEIPRLGTLRASVLAGPIAVCASLPCWEPLHAQSNPPTCDRRLFDVRTGHRLRDLAPQRLGAPPPRLC